MVIKATTWKCISAASKIFVIDSKAIKAPMPQSIIPPIRAAWASLLTLMPIHVIAEAIISIAVCIASAIRPILPERKPTINSRADRPTFPHKEYLAHASLETRFA